MKSKEMQSFVDYIRFNRESEGFELEEGSEDIVRSILDKDVTADECVQRAIQRLELSTEYDPPEHEGDVYPGTKVLANYFNIKDRKFLREVEATIVDYRLAELLANPLEEAFDFAYLCNIHRLLFGDVYPSSGQVRTVVVAKRTMFCLPEYIEEMAAEVFGKLKKDRYLRDKEREEFINELAYYMGEVAALHPFREGNGRATRLFFYELSRNAGYDIDWHQLDPDRLLEADIAAIEGDYQLLIDVLSEIVYQKD